jgi:hypothetical protein
MTMKTKLTSTTLLAAVTVLGLGVAPAFAANVNDASGYAFPGFWGAPSAQPQAPSAPAANRTDGPTVGVYSTQSGHGTWLFPPNPNGGGTNS